MKTKKSILRARFAKLAETPMGPLIALHIK